jgi:hypothetical protein
MGGLRAALDGVCAALASVGIPAAINPEDVQVPGAWVSARDLTYSTLSGGRAVTVRVWLVLADTDDATALDGLEQLLDGAQEALDIDTTTEPVQLAGTLVLPHTPGQPLPAFQFTTTLDL